MSFIDIHTILFIFVSFASWKVFDRIVNAIFSVVKIYLKIVWPVSAGNIYTL